MPKECEALDENKTTLHIRFKQMLSFNHLKILKRSDPALEPNMVLVWGGFKMGSRSHQRRASGCFAEPQFPCFAGVQPFVRFDQADQYAAGLVAPVIFGIAKDFVLGL